MKVLIACEYSGTVRDAFIAAGHDAISCDLLQTEKPGPHYQGNVLDIIGDNFDLMIAHPPCNYISYVGMEHWNNPGRVYKRLEALKFFADLWEAPIKKICLENPKSCASPVIAKYSQEIQPYYFGDPHLKTTWLWLKNLPLLQHSSGPDLFDQGTHVNRPEPIYIDKESGKKRYFTDAISGNSADGAKDRAHFWPGVANAMADQWG